MLPGLRLATQGMLPMLSSSMRLPLSMPSVSTLTGPRRTSTGETYGEAG